MLVAQHPRAFRTVFVAAALAYFTLGAPGCSKPESGSAASGPDAKAVEQVGNLTFLRSEPEARRLSKAGNKLLLIDFYADWCVNCKLWAKQAVSDARLNKALQQAVLLKVYDTDPVFAKYQNDTRFKELTIGLPFFLILGPDGSVRYRSQDYKDVNGMVKALNGG